MSLSYSDFKDQLITHLWRAGDQVVIDNLDSLIRLAESQIGRELRVEDRHATATPTADSLELILPDDYKQMRGVVAPSQNLPPFTYVTPVELQRMRAQHPNAWRPFYSLADNILMLVGYIDPDPTKHISILVDYQRRIPDFKSTDSSWLTDDYLDVYVYGTLLHATPFLREDERLQMWQMMYSTALASALEESEFYKKRGVHASKPLPRAAGINRRGSAYRNKGAY